jgi:heme-degrading monooxygenase HmoA
VRLGQVYRSFPTLQLREGVGVFNRVLTFRGAKNVDDGIAFVRDQALPVLREQEGYRGLFASADRAAGVLGIMTAWDTEANRDASFASLSSLRDEGSEVVGGDLEVETYEQVLEETVSPPTVGSSLLVTRVSMDPAVFDENLEYFKQEVAPQIKAGPGFMHMRTMVNRQTGRSVVGSVWADENAMRTAYEMGKAGRDQGAARGVRFDEDSFRELVLGDAS